VAVSDSFFSRWSRQKTLNRELDQARDAAVAKAPLPAEAEAVPVPKPPVEGAQAVDLPTQADAEALDVGADVSRFLQSGVTDAIKGAALKKLFADPAYNVISDMDDYVEDYSQMAKLSAVELRSLQQSKDLHLFEDPPWKIEADARDAAAAAAAEKQATTDAVAESDTVAADNPDPVGAADAAQEPTPLDIDTEPKIKT
jgi:hypothetical protein